MSHGSDHIDRHDITINVYFADGSDRCETAYLTIKCYRDTDADVDITEWFTHIVPIQ